MLDESLPLTVGEFEEWGNPKIREQYEYMKSYCPYTNLAERLPGHPSQGLTEEQLRMRVRGIVGTCRDPS